MRIVWLMGALALVACSDSSALGGGDLATPDAVCGNGVVETGEACDDGNAIAGDGCENDCTFSCSDDARCDDGDACNGAETCDLAAHQCQPGSALGDGASCGPGRICRAGACGDASCGDTLVTAPEECDDGNTVDGDGCDSCRFSCLSSDAARNCTPADACAGAGVCDDATHVCGAGTAIGDGLPCPQDAARFCKAGVCTTPVCPNGVVELGEICDDGDSDETNGCRTNCTYSCVTPASDCPAPPLCQQRGCTGAHVCQNTPDAAQNGNTCGSGLVCNNGTCSAPSAVCGNSVLESGEDCDLGTVNNTAANGCVLCRFACTLAPNNCVDNNPCNGTDACTAGVFGAQAVHRCIAGAAPPTGTACGGGNICVGGVCKASTCGDGYVNAAADEECDPPAAGSCDSNCKAIVCGNGRRDTGEQCDDGATSNTDGCSASCRFEQAHRANFLRMQFAPTAGDLTYCPSRAVNSAISGNLARTLLNNALDGGIQDGSISILFDYLGLDDLTGVVDANGLSVGVVTGTRAAGTPYDGTNALDWWYTVDTAGLDAMRLPTAQLGGTLAGGTLNLGPGAVTVGIILVGAPATLRMTSTIARVTRVAASVGAPTMSATGPSGHLPGEHLDPALTSFGRMGAITGTGNNVVTTNAGRLCGNISAASLDAVPIPAMLADADNNCANGASFLSCTQCYTSANTLLDVIVGGCSILGTQIAATQPDQNDPAYAPPPPSGGPYAPPYTLTTDAAKRVTGCRDSGNRVVALADCLRDAAYSSLFVFTSQRVILK